ncbi:MAG TPA: AtpZ/AtpI family protein [Pyrinomonadaceae bacterium]|jgi:F0F1-type ATP synthase assembly protein I|nr:AtpZ/AtpI family protein [Pyrinomonadaceae bacterium]
MIKNFIGDDDPLSDEETPPNSSDRPSADILGISDAVPEAEAAAKTEPFILSKAPPESFAETARKSGLAWSAGIAFFASVVFMLIIGWIADLVLGSSPWGIVAGIVLGSLIGFVQFFRITSQIFKN